jgi:photosystem II stability/assembly factor-like uncharacterized protein
MAGWTSITPPGAKAVFALGLDSASALDVATDAGMFRTEDGGASWTVLGAPASEPRQVIAFAFDPLTPSTVYISTAFYGVFKSRDGGRTWQDLSANLPRGYSGYGLVVHPVLSGIIYVGTDGGVWKTVNDGGHWTPMNRGFDPWSDLVRALVIDVSSAETLYAAIGGIFRSTNGGLDWKLLGNYGTESDRRPPGSVRAVALDPQAPETIYAGTAFRYGFEGSPPGDGVYRSDDAGVNWTHLRDGMPPYLAVYSFAFIPSAGIVCAGTSSGVFQIPGAGRGWSPVFGGLPKESVWSLAFDRESDALYAGTGSGLFKLTSASTLKPLTRVPRVAPFRPPS